MTEPIFDAIVVGAGYIGSSVAYHLCCAGLKTALVDQGSIAAGASAANYGNIQIQDMDLTRSTEMTLRGRDCLKTLEEELDWKISYREIGGLLPIENENQWQILSHRKEALNQIGIAAEMIPASQLAEVEPFLDSTKLLGGLYHAHEGQVDPFRLIWGYIYRARQKGLSEYYQTCVQGLAVEHGQIRGIQSSQGKISANNVILCTGAYTAQLGKTIGRQWDVHYVLGQALVTEPTGFILRNHLASASFFEEGAEVEKGTIIANMAISQSVHGHILAGEAMFEADSFPTRVPAKSVPAVSACWLKYFPRLGKLRVLRSWSSPVADVRDGLPMFGPVAGVNGLYLATAFRSTVIVTPLAGKTIAQLLTTGRSELDIRSFLPERHTHETN